MGESKKMLKISLLNLEEVTLLLQNVKALF